MNNTTLSFSKEQLIQIIASIKASAESYQSLFQVLLDAMMLAEREESKLEKDDISNGFRPRRLRGSQGIIELSVPRTRYGNFILSSSLFSRINKARWSSLASYFRLRA